MSARKPPTNPDGTPQTWRQIALGFRGTRGAIRNVEHALQVADFTGLRHGNSTPTNIDGFEEFQNRLFVLFEGKHGAAEMPRGQELALERLCDACASDTREAVFFVVRHNTPASAAINYARTTVTRYRWRGKWHIPKPGQMVFGHHMNEPTLGSAIAHFRNLVFPDVVHREHIEELNRTLASIDCQCDECQLDREHFLKTRKMFNVASAERAVRMACRVLKHTQEAGWNERSRAAMASAMRLWKATRQDEHGQIPPFHS